MPKKKTIRKNAYRDRDKAAGIDRRDIYIDDTSYDLLLDLLDQSGYDTNNNREIKQGVSGVLLHLISFASSKNNVQIITDRKSYQQKVLLARIANKLINSKKSRYSYEDVVDIWNQYEYGKKEIQGISNPKKLKPTIDDFILKYLNKVPPSK